MITIKLPYTSSEEFQKYLQDLRRQQSIVIRSSFKIFQKGNIELKNIRKQFINYKGINLDSWFLYSGVAKAKLLYESCKTREIKKVLFGSKRNFSQYNRKLITKEEYKQKRLNKLVVIGEKHQNGNRKFRLDILKSQILFQTGWPVKRRIKFNLSIPKIKGFYLEQLQYIEAGTNLKDLPLTVELDDKFIYLIFEPKQKPKTRQNIKRVFAIDSNPNSIGWSCIEFLHNDFKVIDSGVFSLFELNKQSKNKRHFETFQLSKFLVEKAKHYQCSKFVIEEIIIKRKDHKKGRVFNRKVNNLWNRNKLFSNITKRCYIDNIELIEINPAYTSIIGNTLHRNYPDPINATFEIARRGYFKYQKDKFYPRLPSVESLNEQWKQTLEPHNLVDWKSLSLWLKNSNYKYRVPLDENRKVFRMKSKKSKICHGKF